MPARKNTEQVGNAPDVIHAAGEVALRLAECGKLEQETLQLVLPSVFGMIRIRDMSEIDGPAGSAGGGG